MAQENKSWLENAIGAQVMTPEKAYQLSQNISKARKQAEGLPLFGNGVIGNLAGGVGSSFARGLANTAGFLNLTPVEKVLNSGSEYIEERLPPPMPAELSLNYIKNPAGWARGIGNVAGSIGSIALPAGVGALAAPNLFLKGAQGLSALTKGKMAVDTAKGVIFGGLTVPMESMMEGQDAKNASLAAGMNPEEANQKKWDVFRRNLGILGVSNMIQGGLFSKLFGKGNTLKGRLGAGAAEVGMQTEGEFLQEGAHNEALGKPFTYNPFNLGNPQYPEQNQAALEGLMGIAPLTAITGGGGYLLDRRSQNKEYEKAAPKLRDWAKNISGNKNSDEVIDLILSNAKKLNYTPEQTKLALALATAESNLSQNAKSGVGAIGVMQLMPETAKELGVDPYKLEDNIYGGLKYLKQQLDRFNGDWQKAAAAYNAGAGAVEKYGGVPNYDETKRYVSRIGGFLADSPQYNGENYEYGRKTNPESILGVESYEMPTQGDNITAQVGQLKKDWEKIIPQIGGALKNKFGLTPEISSAARSAEHNAEVGGSKTSHHIIREDGGDALDIVFAEDTTAEQQQQIADYFKSTGLFKEVLYHDVGSGAHLHLGGLNVENLNPQKSEDGENISETPATRTPFVDEVIKNLLKNNSAPNLQIEQESPLTRAVFKDFVFEKLNDDTDSEFEINRNFFSQHPKLFDKENNFIDSKKNRAVVAEEFSEETIQNFGQNLIAKRIAAIRNIQTPKDSIFFKSSEYTDKSGNTFSTAQFTGTLPKNSQKELENLAYQNKGKSGKKSVFSFGTAEDRDNFIGKGENTRDFSRVMNLRNQ